MKLYIHIGFPNTASSTLQSIFMTHKNINYFGKNLKKMPELNNALKSILFANDTQFNNNQNKIKEAIRSQMQDNSKINILSSEVFLSPYHIYKSDLRLVHKRLFSVLSNINEISSLKLIIIYRDQLDTLIRRNSWGLSGYVKFKNHLALKLRKNKISRQEHNVYESLKYDNLYYLLKNIYGSNEVKFFKYEDIFVNYFHVKKFSDYLSLDENELKNYFISVKINKTKVIKNKIVIKNKTINFFNKLIKSFNLGYNIIYFIFFYRLFAIITLKKFLFKKKLIFNITNKEKNIIKNYYKISNLNFKKIVNE